MLTEVLGHQPPLRVLPLDWEETIRWATGTSRTGQVSILDLPSSNQDAVLAVAHAVVVPVPATDVRAIDSLLPLRFQMVAAENGAPVFVLIHSVKRATGRSWVTEPDLVRQGVQPLAARIPHSMRIAQVARSPWASNWSDLADSAIGQIVTDRSAPGQARRHNTARLPPNPRGRAPGPRRRPGHRVEDPRARLDHDHGQI